MAKIVELKKKIGKIFGKKDNEEGGEEIGSYSMNEGETGNIFGINRNVVKGIVGFFVTFFAAAVIYNTTDSEEAVKVEEPKQLADNEIADADRAKNNLPSDYESFVAMRQEKDKAQQSQQPQQQAQPAKVEEKPVEVKTQATPVIPKSSYPEIILPQQNQVTVPQVQIPQIATQEEKKPEKIEREKYGAPIAFSSFAGAKEAEKNSEAEVEDEKPTKVSYQKANLSGISAGTIMSARLLTGINSEVEGQVVAQILSDVYNAGRTKILIPQGSKVVGTYKKSEVSSDRVPLEFDKVILPDGGQLKVEKNLVAVDGAGYTGIKGKVHHHIGRKVTAAAMGAALAAIGSSAAGNSGSSGNNNYSAGELAKQGAMANLMNVTSKMFEDASKIGNTVTVEPGYEFQIYVKEDLEF